ncbi:MAG: 3-deoxy-manno-octulosonate cytidylyltransferase [Armatimonadota bacterium]|nr:3-deoxy-manno-octulosonate cytidylyltransferase [Armatimonadota bacterium]
MGGLRASTRITAIIPARMASTRLPGKPLLDLCGKPIIQWVYERAVSAGCFDSVIVAAPDPEILAAVEAFGGQAVLTSTEHRSGSDRIAEVCRKMDTGEIIVNVQGDEPLLEPRAVARLASALAEDDSIRMGSLMRPLDESDDPDDPNLVKVVVDRNGFALYFSRSRIPYIRDTGMPTRVYGHIGVYAYRKDFLLEFTSSPPTVLEKAESLEQLRALENGHRIKMIETSARPIGVDTPEDLERVRALVSSGGIE